MGDLEAQLELDQLREANRQLQRQLARAKARTDDIVQAIHDAVKSAAINEGRPCIASPPKDRRKKSAEVCLLHTTDWQIAKITATYNTQIARHRLVDILCARVEKIVEIHRADHPVREAHYLYGGDMTEGIGIFPGQAFAIDATLFEQIFAVASIMEAQLLHALTVFDTVHVWEEKGNHGRYGKKGEAPDHDNFDLIAYRIVHDRFKDEPRIVWHPLESPGIWNLATIGNYRALLFHGDEIKSYGGNLPAFGITRKLTSWLAGVAPTFDDAYGGHFHTHAEYPLPSGGSIFMTGSPESDNTYAFEVCGATGSPSQRLHFVDPERGRVTAVHKLWLS